MAELVSTAVNPLFYCHRKRAVSALRVKRVSSIKKTFNSLSGEKPARAERSRNGDLQVIPSSNKPVLRVKNIKSLNLQQQHRFPPAVGQTFLDLIRSEAVSSVLAILNMEPDTRSRISGTGLILFPDRETKVTVPDDPA